jgi:hypothetical protein
MGRQGGPPRPAGGASSLAGLVRMLRERALLSQEELAERAGLSVRTIRGIESNRLNQPRGSSIRLLADALGLAGQDRTALFEVAVGELARPAHGGGTVPSGPRGTAAAAEAPHGGSHPVPGQLPADLAEFTGREGF